MIKRFRDLLSESAYLADDGLRYGYYFSLVRGTLQAAAIAAVEYCYRHAEEIDRPALGDHAKKLLQTSDGEFLAILNWAIPVIRSTGWSRCVPDWFDAQNALPSGKDSLHGLVSSLIQERNSRIGHGVLDSQTIAKGLLAIPRVATAIIEGLSDLLPTEQTDGSLVLETPIDSLRITSHFLVDGCPVVIRRIDRRGSAWRVTYQPLNPTSSAEAVREISDSAAIPSAVREAPSALRSVTFNLASGATWNPSYIVPFRQTDTFESRKEELRDLLEWWNDPDSRACLVYGEGGIGKTTLVLEFLNRMLSDPPEALIWRPSVIFYYSAKQTRWGLGGLEYIQGVVPSLSDAIRAMASVLLGSSVSRTWKTEEPRSLIDRTASLFAEVGLNRTEILVVIDNTETLARTLAAESALTDALRHTTRRLGRLIVTSRRREEMEAAPIHVRPLPPDAGEALLARLAETYHVEPLRRAGPATLRRVAKQLSGKPLLIDILARHISRAACSIDDGVRSILSQQRHELGRFLFDDAWQRIDERHRNAFLVLGQLGGNVAGQVVAWICGEVGVSLTDWLGAFEETHFGLLNEYGTHYDLSIEPSAREYVSTKYRELPNSERARIDRIAKVVRERYLELLRADAADVTDRIEKAFRTSVARAAKLAALRGDEAEAVTWYEEAVAKDPGNAALLDRFAWYLMVNRHLERAWHMAKQACAIDRNDAEAHFTAGMIAARRGNIADADTLLGRARELGKEPHLCDLQRARARIEYLREARRDSPESSRDAASRRAEWLDEAAKLLHDASIENPTGSNDCKHMRERERLLFGSLARLQHARR